MSEQSDPVLSLELPCDPAAPATVRDALSELPGLDWVLGDVMLVASELVNNAVLHSGCPPEDTLDITVALESGAVSVRVLDPGVSGKVARPKPAAEFDQGGWGLKIVEQLSSRWGTRRSDGYEVWAEVALPAAPEQREPPADGAGHAVFPF